MIDHVNLPVRNLATSKAFYDPLLATLGMKPLMVDSEIVGYGQNTWVFGIEVSTGEIPQIHLAFKAKTRDHVIAFHKTALSNGAACNGTPAQRDAYGPHYFAAFIIDPNGHNIEAVFRG